MQLYRGYLMAATLGVALALTSSADSPKLVDRRDLKEPTNDKEFVACALSCEVAQVKFAEKAAKNANSDKVRELAEKIAEDHKKVRDDLLQQAKRMKLAVVEGLEKEHRDQY